MKRFAVLLITMFAAQCPLYVHALPCATTGAETYRGDSIGEVSNRCGPAYSQNAYAKTTPSKQEWVYYKRNPLGFINKMTLLIINNNVANIVIDEDNLPNTGLCGLTLQAGNSAEQAENICGEPTYIQILESNTVHINELQYSELSPKTWVFENGKLVDWKD